MKTKKTILLFLIIAAAFSSVPAQDTVHVVFKTHMDIGFTDFPHKVVERYFNEYIPGSISTAEYMHEYGNGNEFLWTTGAWLIYKFLNEASSKEVQMLEQAIRKGYIDWHAYPFSGYNMLMNEDMFEQSLSIAGDLDKKFGKKTISAKLTDLPGESRSVINILARHGIQVLHIGTNPGHYPPKTPPVFCWRDPEGNELIVILQGVYGETLVIPGFSHALYFAFTNDNQGPQTPEMVERVFKEVQLKFPHATVIASTLDEFASRLITIKSRLPVLTSDIGNTWIHSAASDPLRTAQYRALQRLFSSWFADGKAGPEDQVIKDFARNLLMVTEHTGGLDEKSHLDFMHWSPESLAKMRDKDNYRDMETSWDEARSYINKAVNALGESPLAIEAKNELEKLVPSRTELPGFTSLDISKPVQTKYFTIRFDKQTGAIVSLLDGDKRQWADPLKPLGLFWHESFDYADFERFRKQYNNTDALWVLYDFAKPMMDGDRKATDMPYVTESYIRTDKEKTSVVLLLKFPTPLTDGFVANPQFPVKGPTDYGLPELAEISIIFPANSKELQYKVQWFNKKANRLPEAYWFSVNLADCDPEAWRIEVINRMISPLDVVSYGGKNLQAFNRGVFYKKQNESISIQSLDCGIVAPGQPSLLDFSDRTPDLSGGWHFNLYNNKWGTNFPTWYDDDAMFRFVINLNEK